MAARLGEDAQSELAHDHRLRRRRNSRFSPIESECVDDLAAVFEDKDAYRSFLRSNGPLAERKLDLLQSVLDHAAPYSNLWKQSTVALQRLSIRTGLFPSVYELRGVRKLEEEAVANGAYGQVYRGEYNRYKVSIKMLWLNQKERKKVMKFYAREAILWGQLSHRNILPFYGICTLDFRPCLISPWAENGNVMEYLERNPRVDRLALVQDITEGLRYLHSRGIIHGDLKGANILVDLHGCACLADFGLSSVYDKRILDWTSQSAAISSGGTFRWQAPELLGEAACNTKESDMYAWACTCYEIFTGQVPYASAATFGLIFLQKIQGTLPSHPFKRTQAWADAGLSDSIWNILRKCWDSQPEKRSAVADVQAEIGGRSSLICPTDVSVLYTPEYQHVFCTPFFFLKSDDGFRSLGRYLIGFND